MQNHDQLNNEDYILSLLSKYMNGRITDYEKKVVEDFLLSKSSDNSDSNASERISRKLWTKLAEHLKLKDKSLSNTQKVNKATEEDFKKYIFQIQAQRNKKTLKYRDSKILSISRYAAAVVILGILYLGWQHISLNGLFNNESLTEYRNFDSVKRITLADGSVIYLNKDSEVSINKKEFNNKNREVWMNGEAYFEVSSNQEKPFIVHNGDFSIEVKGTAFNIRNYNEIGKYVVSVTHGRVQVNKGATELGLLTVNKELVYDNSTNSYEILDKNCTDSYLWTKGILLLDNANIQEIKLRLKQHFGVELIINVDTSYFNHVQFSSPALDKTAGVFDIMERFCAIYDLNFKISEDGSKCYLTE